ncbi:hypothetical protein A2634_01680 [Candidatus Amesbacteria bacterium RIFCSPHIGHO2_01_FULL_48_32]|uniref:Uncharacterized protein n=1 Tax=Candidatus Amesbacteria bacterium RIFCSPLOWO2_01_FULL_48_25 TaxID=1797259 RepID=A0A1F4ZBU2_9BACT|nr:MAG: hypothetical protein A2634_01680 [Candidatus Amesbacteria bacterium RIFCSPHIGHO2_01_FULL_48_32]OGD03752.1 MAG: hypothetical protein A2989_03665 [Candidatus Amesbacteria bacterium RIFCSPLOWO2_01_FULL_48_25]HJZ05900.1 hypothetical protein [Patescibacteria group bacterium]
MSERRLWPNPTQVSIVEWTAAVLANETEMILADQRQRMLPTSMTFRGFPIVIFGGRSWVKTPEGMFSLVRELGIE